MSSNQPNGYPSPLFRASAEQNPTPSPFSSGFSPFQTARPIRTAHSPRPGTLRLADHVKPKPIVPSTPAPSPPKADPRFQIATKLSTLFNNPSFSDVTVVASDSTTFHAHLAILGLHTEFFSAAVSSTSSFAESTTKTVSFPEHTPSAVRSILEYCYKCSYNYPKTTDALGHFDTYMLADYLMLEDLKGEIVERLREELVLQKLANRADNDKAWREKFPELVVRVYGNTGREEKRGGNVRKVVVEAANHALMKGPSEMTVAPLRAVMEDIGEFAADLVEEQVKAVRMERSSGFFEGSEEGEKA